MKRNLINIEDLSKKDIFSIFKRADELREDIKLNNYVDTSRVGALLFFEPSTRTRIGFEIATWKLGVKSIVMQETKFTEKMSEAESMRDTIRTLNPYVDFFCIRHPDENIFNEVVDYTSNPIINCGNGHKEHPTQALINAYTIWKNFNRLDDIKITLIGAPRHTRAVHSFIMLLAKFSNIKICEVCPTQLQLQKYYKNLFEVNENRYIRSQKHKWGNEKIVYVTGFPPKNPSGIFPQELRDNYKITKSIADKLSQDCIILDDLPRIDEIDYDVDDLENAYYFKQNELGLFVRMAVIDRFCL